jgi:hypothetical protein
MIEQIHLQQTMENLKEIVKTANQAVEGIDEPLKSKAFEKILDKLLNEVEGNRKSKRKPKLKKTITKKGRIDEVLEKLSNSLNRSEHPVLHELKKTLDKSLYILSITEKKNLDGLTSPQIAYLLTNTFRIKTTAAAVSMALMDAKLKVDRKPMSTPNGGKAFVYKLMKTGEDHLDKVIKEVSRK